MKQVTFIKKSIFGAKGESRLVTDRAAEQYAKLGLIEQEKEDFLDAEVKELIPEAETKPLETEAEKKELEPEVETKVLEPVAEVKVTTSPKEDKPKKGSKGKK